MAPDTGTGSVSTCVSAASWSASPSTETTSGSTSTDAMRKPWAGVPVTFGFTGRVFVSRLVNSGIVTWTERGSRSTPVTTAPASSTGFASTVRSKSMPSGERATFTCAATTWLTAVAGPVTLTVGGRERHLADVDARGWRALVDLDRDHLRRHLVEHDLDRARLGVEDRHPRVDGVDGDPDVDLLPVGLDVGQVDGRHEVLGAQPGHVRRRDVPDLVDVAEVVRDLRAGRLVDGRDGHRARET